MPRGTQLEDRVAAVEEGEQLAEGPLEAKQEVEQAGEPSLNGGK